MSLRSLLQRRFGQQVALASDERVEPMRPEIDAFLRNVLSAEEQEYIETYFISDEATIFDCSLGLPEDWQRQCQEVYGVRLSHMDLKMSLYRLVEVVRERSASK